MNTLNLGLAGRYQLIATKDDGSQRVLADWFDNLILDSGLDRLGTGGAWDKCEVGAGNTAPAAGQTALIASEATTTTVTSTTAGTNTPTNTYAWARRTYRFGVGVAAGNLTEVGIGWTGGALFSRALIKDGAGDPTTITVLADEYLDVVYEIRAYPELADQTFNLTIAGVPYTFTSRPVRFSGNHGSSNLEWPLQLWTLMDVGVTASANLKWAAYGNGAALAAITASDPSGGTQLVSSSTPGNTSSFVTTYVPGSYQRVVRNTFSIAAGSSPFGGFTVLTPCGDYQVVVSPDIPKDGTKQFSLDYVVSWARKVI